MYDSFLATSCFLHLQLHLFCLPVYNQPLSHRIQGKVVFSKQAICPFYTFSGPFVMTTQEEIMQAMSDYRGAKNGFENAATWNSTYAD